ncbi:MAG: calcium-binding protein [Pseudomonadota bacterium]
MFGPGDGSQGSFSDLIEEDVGAGTDTIMFRAGIDPDDVYLRINSFGHLEIRWGTADDERISVMGAMTRDPLTFGILGSDVPFRIERIAFDDGTIWYLRNGMTLRHFPEPDEFHDELVSFGTPEGDLLLSGPNGFEFLYGNGGNDVIRDAGGAGDRLEGGPGDDVYEIAPDFNLYTGGTAPDVIREFANEGFDTIAFLAGVAPSDVSMTVATDGDLILEVFNDPDRRIIVEAPGVTDPVSGGLSGSAVGERVEQITFSDGTVWDLREFSRSVLTLTGTENAETINGTVYDDTILGLGGNDQLIGGSGNDSIDGGDGDDTAVFSGGFYDYSGVFNGIRWTVADARVDAPDGIDTLINVEFARFADRTVALDGAQFISQQQFDGLPGDDLYLQRPNGNYFIVNGETGQFSDGIGRGTDTVADLDDFTGDGASNALFRRPDGSYYVHDQVNDQVFGLGRSSETFVATVDIDGDGVAGVVFQRANGNHYLVDTSSNFVIGYGRATETILAVGDFDGDGGDDLLIERADGTYVWIDGATRAPSGLSRSADDVFVGVGDFNGDGVDDVLFERGSNGATVAFSVDGALMTAFGRVTQKAVAIGDFDGDRADDILFDDLTSRAFVAVDGATADRLGTFFSDARVATVGDFVVSITDEVLIETQDGRYVLSNGLGEFDYGQAENTLMALDPLGTGSLNDSLLV